MEDAEQVGVAGSQRPPAGHHLAGRPHPLDPPRHHALQHHEIGRTRLSDHRDAGRRGEARPARPAGGPWVPFGTRMLESEPRREARTR